MPNRVVTCKLAQDVWSRLEAREGRSHIAEDLGTSERTVQRLAKAQDMFEADRPRGEIGTQTGWSVETIRELKEYWGKFQETRVKYGHSPTGYGDQGEDPDQAERSGHWPSLRSLAVGSQDVRCNDKDYLMRQSLRTLEGIPISTKAFGNEIRHWLTDRHPMYAIVRDCPDVDESGNATVAPITADDYQWPLSPAVVIRDRDSNFSVTVFGEERTEWRCLQQHLCNDPVWAKYEDWKTALVASLASKSRLFDKLVSLVEAKIGLPVIDDNHCEDTTTPHLHPEVPYALYEQAICQAYEAFVGPPSSIPPITLDQFVHEAEGEVRRNGRMIIHGCGQEHGDRLVQWLVDFQSSLADLVEAREAAEAHQTEEHQTAELKRHIKRIRLMSGHLPGSSCDSCRPWVDAQVPNKL
jgi:hypothetical protein